MGAALDVDELTGVEMVDVVDVTIEVETFEDVVASVDV